MTDHELIELIQTRSPEELSLGEVAELRRRMTVSPEVRQALGARVEMEQYLSAGLTPVQISVDAIIARAGRANVVSSGVLPLLGWGLCLLLVGFVSIVLIVAIVFPPSGADREQPLAEAATKTPIKKEKETAAAAAKKPPVENPKAGQVAPVIKSAATAEVAVKPATTDKPDAKPADATPTGAKPDATKPPVKPAAKPTPVKPTPKPAEPIKDVEPWERTLAAAEQGGMSPSALFEEIDRRVPSPQEVELKRWFTGVPGQGHQIANKNFNNIQLGFINGLVRLQSPWKPNTALRMALHEHNNLRLHFWSGLDGITLHYYDAGKTWVAYHTTRKAGEPKPATLGMAATDEDRYWRTNPMQEPANIELRWSDGLITLSRGDVLVLSAPLAGPPAEVYFEGQATFRQLALVPAAPLPAEAEPRPLVLDETQPARLAWMGQLPEGSQFAKLPDGRVELSAEKNALPAWVAVRIPQQGVCEMEFQLDDPLPGSAVYLGDEQGQPRYLLRFLKDQRTGWISMAQSMIGDNQLDSNLDANSAPAPFAARQPWVRMLFGCGIFKCWTSADGLHWGRVWEPFRNQPLGFSSAGICCIPAQPRHGVALRHLRVRELAAINSLAPAELRGKVPGFASAPDMGQWLEMVIESQPEKMDAAVWRAACAVRTLAQGAAAPIAVPLLDNLLDDALQSDRSPAEKLRILDEAALLAPTADDPAVSLNYASRYEALGKLLLRGGETRPYTAVARAQRMASIWNRNVYNFTPDGLIRDEIIELAYHRKWEELAELCKRVRFWVRPANPQDATLADWGSALAAQQLPKTARGGTAIGRGEWRHPLVVELSKEGFNVLAEFQAALDGKSYRDACQIISMAADRGTLGLLPDHRDPELLVSLAGAVTLAMREHPALQTTMSEQFGPLGRLRIRQAIADCDLAAVESATLQFLGTEAAADAHVWLGDRALSSGAFARALGHYRQARRTSGPALRNRIGAAEQLAGAMMGHTTGEPVSGSVEFGETKLSAGELQALVADLRKSRAQDKLVTGAAGQNTRSAPAPVGFSAAPKSKLEGEMGDAPNNVPGELNQLGIDWTARQVATVVDGDRMLLSNRFQVASYDVKSGQFQWRTGLGGEQAYAHEWSCVPLRPLVVGGRVFVRRLLKTGPTLACLEEASGKLLWTTKPEPEKFVVSDPLFIQDELFALTVVRVEQELTLSLATYDPQSGAMLNQRPLVKLRDHWWQQRTCQAVAMEDALIVNCGGSVLCCDLMGQVRWLRRQTWMPPALDRTWIAQRHDLPLVEGGLLYVAQPSVRSISCIDPENGRLQWQQVLPSLRGIVGIAAKVLIVEVDEGFIGFAADSGKELWRHDADRLLEARLCGGPGGFVYARSHQVRNENAWQPCLVWVDPKSGKETGRSLLETLKHEKPKFGPLVSTPERLWAFFGRGDTDPLRDIVELTPSGKPASPPDVRSDWDRWARHFDAALRLASSRVLPDWRLLDSAVDANTGLLPEWQAETEVLSTLATPGHPVRLARHIDLPAGSKPQLRMRVANEPGGKWKLDVHVGQKQVLERSIDPGTPNAWKSIDLDLSEFAGRSVWIVVRQTSEGGPQPYAKWKRLDVTF